MDSAVTTSPPRRTRRRWRVPPAIMHGPESLESAGVLDEFAGVTGVVLWQSLRDVTLWAGTPPSERGKLFSDSAERNRIAALLASSLLTDLEQPLGMITSMVGRPGKVSPQRVALACRHISQWAEKQGKLATSLAFAQAGALVCPGDASAGYKVGQLARRRAEYARAETWYRRSIALGRQEGDWVSYSLAFLGLGNLYAQRGNLPAAKRLHVRGLRAAKRHSLRDIQGRASHDLHVIATMTGELQEAQRYAWSAYEAYRPSHPLLPRLAHDVAYFWMTQGCFAPSLTVFQALLPHMASPQERFIVLPNVIRAAGSSGSREVFELMWMQMSTLLEAEACAGDRENLAEGLLEMARGAASLGEWEKADWAANRAVESARRRKEARIELTAEALLESCANEQRAANREPMKEAEHNPDVEEFAQALVHCLEMREVAV